MFTAKNGFYLWAHRGASAFAPENTLASFRLAESLDADGIELDVHLSSDGVPVVIHDETLERTTDGRGNVARMTVDRLQQLDAGSWFDPRFQAETIPTLQEVLAWAGSRLALNVEIKTPEAALGVLSLLKEHPDVRVLVSSFNHGALEILSEEDPLLPLGFLTEGYFWRRALRRARAAGAYSFHPNIDRLSDAMQREVLDADLRLFPFTVDDPLRAQQLRSGGVQGIFTNCLFPHQPTAAQRASS